ncbi:hypothetical protein CAPTEDRAFT_210509 [Capitella teleta]|uniref:Protein phosphatase 1 regulatory subunit 19 n=1 Tax=Capitella teleta TaxID=283909 RepID=R7VEG8_CAPTE|nr:hypothetical protein CAPTEDRAFT_210509 [Capitella teleta]|eukprot:ELU17218.1 hypothetical protein CAPTEDRAFT_210509 [Capitella teleta]
MAMAQPHDLQRLREEQSDAVRETQDKMAKLESFKRDYESLKQRLKTLPEKVTHDVMVPFGRLAFMPGQLIHTNEIMVLLGDNWFVERSAKQATDILCRRMQGLDEQIADLNKQLNLLNPRLDFTSQLQELNQAKNDWFEIKEEFDEEKEKLWKEQHKKNIRQHRAKSMAEKKKRETSDDDADIWLKLDQLQANERRNREMTNMASDEDYETRLSNKIQQMMEAELGGEVDEEEVEEEEEEEESEEEAVQTINFTHSRFSPDLNKAASNEIVSPSDIYKRFSSPKSILKSSEMSATKRRSSVTFKEETLEREDEEVVSKPVQPANAFCGSVMERVPSDDVVSQPSASDSEAKPVKVSRFKQQRMKQAKS